MPIERPKGMTAFTLVWLGQVASMLGTAMSGFGLLIWIWERSQQATTVALLAFFQFVPLILMTPIAGALVDRWSRKKAMILSDLSAGMGTLTILILYTSDFLQIWHLYIIGVFVGALGAFQFPAYSAAVTLMVEKKHYARASGMLGVAGSISGIAGPPLAATMLALYGLTSVLIIDLITLPIAISMLLIIYIPELPPSKSKSGLVPLLKESVFGFKFIYARKPLLWLQLTFFTFNFISAFGIMLVAPMLLARTGNDKLILGSVQSAGGVGGLVGGIVLAIWGGPKRRINGLLGGMTILGALSSIIFVSTFIYIWMIGLFFFFFFMPMINGSSQAIWQSKVPPELQGKVFGARMLIAQISNVFGLALVGPLADRVFEPAMAPGGGLTSTFGWLIGTGPGTGMTVMILITGILLAFVGAIAYSISTIRNVETIVPDFDEQKKGQKEEKDEREKPKETEQEKTV